MNKGGKACNNRTLKRELLDAEIIRKGSEVIFNEENVKSEEKPERQSLEETNRELKARLEN
jgi:hypothetical protein